MTTVKAVMRVLGSAACVAVVLPGAASAGRLGQDSGAPAYETVLQRYCITCHNQRLQTANLVLDTAGLDRIGDDAELWEKVLRKL
ncbi:uncharacterized protein METZ01_LOCUS440071, partial [marine metagenome]